MFSSAGFYLLSACYEFDNVLDSRDATLDRQTEPPISNLFEILLDFLWMVSGFSVSHLKLYNLRLDPRPGLNDFVWLIGYLIIHKIN